MTTVSTLPIMQIQSRANRSPHNPPDTFRNNQMIYGGVMTSYLIFNVAAIESEIYFRVGIY